MAGAGYKLFNTGDVLTAAQVNTYLQEQVVMVFANAAARTTALSSVLAEGMVSYLKDTDALEIYSGSAWVGYGSGDITGVTAGTGISGGGTSGTVTITNAMATEITAAGDIIVGTGSGTFDNLPIGTTGQVLTADTTVSPYKVKWATTSGASAAGCLIYPNLNVDVPNNTSTIIDFDLEAIDTDNYHSTSTNKSRITIPSGKAGKYYVFWTTGMNNSSTTGQRRVIIKKNGNGYQDWLTEPPAGTWFAATGATMIDCAVGDYLQLEFLQTSGGTRSYYGDSSLLKATQFGAFLIGA